MKKSNPDIIRDALATCKRAFLYALLFSLPLNLFGLVTSIYSLQILDRVITSGSVETLLGLTVIVLVAYLFFGVLYVVRSLIFDDIGNWLERTLAPKLLNLSIQKSSTKKTLTGSQLLRDLTHFKNFIAGYGLSTIFDVPWAPIYIVVIFMIHYSLGLIVVTGAVVLTVIAWLNELATSKTLGNANEQSIQSYRDIENITRNAEVVEALGMTNTLVDRWRMVHFVSAQGQSKANRKNSFYRSLAKSFRLIISMLIYCVGAIFVLKHQMTAGGIIAASILSSRALAPFDAAISIWRGLVMSIKSYNRLKDALGETPVRHEAMSLPPPEGGVRFEKVIYKPNGAKKPIIKGLSLDIQPGELVGIVGPSGSGKTTLAKLTMGVWKTSAGVIRLDEADVYTWNREEFGNFVGYIPQDVELFEGTVKENIARMSQSPDPEMVVKAAQDAFIHEMILNLPKGYETEIGIGGENLSAGQRQRIALARAYYGVPKLVVMDEPNSNLDKFGESALAMSLDRARENGSTVLVITHRTNILTMVDKILVLNDGQKYLYGPRDEVISQLSGKPAKQLKGKTNNGET